MPDSNPTFPEDFKSAIYAIGLRNPYRASFGPNGELVVADVGEGTWEEVDVGSPTGTPAATTLAAANLGWPICEGRCEPAKSGMTDPVFQYPHSGPSEETTGCAILGGYVVRDPQLTGLTGRYLYGDLCRPDLRTLNLGHPGADPQPAGISIPQGDLRGLGKTRADASMSSVRERLPSGLVGGRRGRLPAAPADIPRAGRGSQAARPGAPGPPARAVAPGADHRRHLRRVVRAFRDRVAANLEGEGLGRLHGEKPSPRLPGRAQPPGPRLGCPRHPDQIAPEDEEAGLPARQSRPREPEEREGACPGDRVGPERQLEDADGGN